MATDQERIEALEQFAVRITRLTNADWVDQETRDAFKLAMSDPSKKAALFQFVLLLAEGRAKLQPLAPAAPAAVSVPIDRNEVLRRNAILFDYYDRQVGVAKSYTTVLTTVGYAGLLAIWAGLRDHIDKGSLLWSAVLMGLSILVFAAWEIGKFQLIQMGAATFDQVVQEKFHTPEFETVAATAHVEHNAKISAFNRVQPIIFWVTALSGFGAGGLILWAAIRAATGVRLTFG